MELHELGAVPQALRSPQCSCCFSAYSEYLGMILHILSKAAPNHHTKRLSPMPLKNLRSQIDFTAIMSNTFVVIILEQAEEELVRKHYILPLSQQVMAFTCPL